MIHQTQLGFDNSRFFTALIFLPKCDGLLKLLSEEAQRTPGEVLSLTQQVGSRCRETMSGYHMHLHPQTLRRMALSSAVPWTL